MFKTFENIDGEYCYMENSTTSKVGYRGTIILKMSLDKESILTDVLYVPDICKNLISGSVLGKKDFQMMFEYDKVVINKNEMYVGRGYLADDLFKMNVTTIAPKIVSKQCCRFDY